VPQAGDPSSLNRYAYARLNPLQYVDPTGHCCGPVSFVRGLPGYGVTCGNLEMALTIVQHPQATWEQKLLAGSYIAVVGAAHGALLVGLGMLAWEGGSALLAGGGAAGSAVQAACADADCTNEVQAVVRAGQQVWAMNPLERGRALHQLLGQNLPDRFPVVDRMVWEEGRVISIKTLDLGAKSYQNLARLQQVVQGYIQKLAEFSQASYGGASIGPEDIKIRELWLVIPGASEASDVPRQLTQYFREPGVVPDTSATLAESIRDPSLPPPSSG
jgi:hypothetical protein